MTTDDKQQNGRLVILFTRLDRGKILRVCVRTTSFKPSTKIMHACNFHIF